MNVSTTLIRAMQAANDRDLMLPVLQEAACNAHEPVAQSRALTTLMQLSMGMVEKGRLTYTRRTTR